MTDKIVDLDGKRVKVIRQVDTSRHDSKFQQRVNALNGLFIVEDVDTGNIRTAYGSELGITP